MCPVIVRFRQSSYNIKEDRGEVMIVMRMSRRSSESFEVMIKPTDITANSE